MQASRRASPWWFSTVEASAMRAAWRHEHLTLWRRLYVFWILLKHAPNFHAPMFGSARRLLQKQLALVVFSGQSQTSFLTDMLAMFHSRTSESLRVLATWAQLWGSEVVEKKLALAEKCLANHLGGITMRRRTAMTMMTMTMMTMMSMRSGTLITTKLMQHRSKNGKCEMPRDLEFGAPVKIALLQPFCEQITKNNQPEFIVHKEPKHVR